MQSSTVALMIAKGEIPMVDGAVFADTGAEPKHVHRYLDWLEGEVPFPIHKVMHKEGLRENIIGALLGGRFAGAPFFTESPSGKGQGRLRRQCTREFKIQPIVQQVRELLGLAKGERAKKGIQVVQYIGISTDEASRMKPSQHHYIENQWPLIELGMSRADCMKWLTANGYPIPGKSACTFCPYHDDKLWADMKKNDPESFADAVEIDEMIRGGVKGTTQKLYLHRSMKPLRDVQFGNAKGLEQTDMFQEECEGICGV